MKNRKQNAGIFRKMLGEWKWVLRYSARYRGYIILYVFLALVGTAMALAVSVMSKYLIDAVISHDNAVLPEYAGIVIGLGVCRYLFQSLTSWITAVVGTKTDNAIRSEIYSHMIRADWEEISAFHSGDLLNRLEGDVSTVSSGVIGFIPNLFSRSLQFFGSLAIVLYYDRTMALLALLSAPFLFFSSRLIVRVMRKYNLKSREMNGKILSYSEESMQNMQVIKAFDLTKRYISSFADLLSAYRNVRLDYERFAIVMTLSLSLIGMVTAYACYGWGVYRLWQGAITYGTMTLFLQIAGGLSSSFSSLASLAPSAVSVATAAGRITEITEHTSEEDRDRETALSMLQCAADTGIGLTVDGVSFAYRNAKQPVLENISFSVVSGETVALVGPSGEGKTTLLKLMLGLLAPQNGGIEVRLPDGKKLAVSDSTRRFFSYVPQSPCIFSGTVGDNLRLSDEDATDEELISVLRQAELWEHISSLPDGLQTEIGENGGNFSQGQLQRLSIARALLRKAPILLLDEATSALDVRTEKKILDNIMQNDPLRVCIATTHRESMLQYCDRVFVVTAGGCTEKKENNDKTGKPSVGL